MNLPVNSLRDTEVTVECLFLVCLPFAAISVANLPKVACTIAIGMIRFKTLSGRSSDDIQMHSNSSNQLEDLTNHRSLMTSMDSTAVKIQTPDKFD